MKTPLLGKGLSRKLILSTLLTIRIYCDFVLQRASNRNAAKYVNAYLKLAARGVNFAEQMAREAL